MEEKKKVVIPGEHVSSYEEAEPGENCYAKGDDIFSAALGEPVAKEGKMNVRIKGRRIVRPHAGMEVYCVVARASPNNALCDCIPAIEAEEKGRGVGLSGALHVSAIRRGHVRDVRDEVKIGDVIRAKVAEVTKTGLELTTVPDGFGVVRAFCPRCRQGMDLKAEIFICSSCGWKERRKLASRPVPRG